MNATYSEAEVQALLKGRGFKGDEMLMEENSGDVDTAESYAEDCITAAKACGTEDGGESAEEQFSSLFEVVKDKTGAWVAA